jgi:type II restriction/modification system DNA methylase subunit YeeA
LGLAREFPRIGPEAVKGIEINRYAAELARVTVWIGEIQWMRRNGFDVGRNPILKPLGTVECRDAILNPDGSEAEWPEADVVIGNPPFLGDKLMIGLFASTTCPCFVVPMSAASLAVPIWFAIGFRRRRRFCLVGS